MPTPQEEYFTRSVTELADILPITTCQDVMSTTGLKLVNKGVRLDSTFSEKLCKHSILPPLEQCLVVENGITTEDIVSLAKQLLSQDPAMMRMVDRMQNPLVLIEALRSIPLCDPIIFLLTLAQERRSSLLRHSVKVALICLYLGRQQNLPMQKLVELATAGLLHDLSELRINEKLLREGAHPTRAERELIYTHPASSQRILLNAEIYPLEIINAVMRHHECIDGSGYPFGLVGSEMEEADMILSLAELVATKLDQEVLDGKPHLEIALKYNLQKFHPALLKHLTMLYEHNELDTGEVPTLDLADVALLQQQIRHIFLAIEFWKRLKGDIPIRLRSPSVYIQQRLLNVAQAAREAGINIANAVSVIEGLEGDESCLQDLYQVNLETLNELREIVFEVQRRWPQYPADLTAIGAAVNGWMEYMQELLLEKRERVK